MGLGWEGRVGVGGGIKGGVLWLWGGVCVRYGWAEVWGGGGGGRACACVAVVGASLVVGGGGANAAATTHPHTTRRQRPHYPPTHTDSAPTPLEPITHRNARSILSQPTHPYGVVSVRCWMWRGKWLWGGVGVGCVCWQCRALSQPTHTVCHFAAYMFVALSCSVRDASVLDCSISKLAGGRVRSYCSAVMAKTPAASASKRS